MKIVILGSTGMLGSAVGKYFLEKYSEDNVYLSYRNEEVSYGKNKFLFDLEQSKLKDIPNCDYIINCIGVIKPFIEKNIPRSIQTNSMFPRILAEHCKAINCKLIHITTDCVFSGADGNYTEDSLHDCTDSYGKTKSLGEPINCMTIRTSIIGEELHKNVSLISWVNSQKGKEVNGFSNHLWNGITTKQYAKICSQIIDQALYQEGIYHVFSNSVNKYELLCLLNERFNLDLKINKTVADSDINRTLSTVKELNSFLSIPSIEEQIKEI